MRHRAGSTIPRANRPPRERDPISHAPTMSPSTSSASRLTRPSVKEMSLCRRHQAGMCATGPRGCRMNGCGYVGDHHRLHRWLILQRRAHPASRWRTKSDWTTDERVRQALIRKPSAPVAAPLRRRPRQSMRGSQQRGGSGLCLIWRVTSIPLQFWYRHVDQHEIGSALCDGQRLGAVDCGGAYHTRWRAPTAASCSKLRLSSTRRYEQIELGSHVP